MFSMPHATHLLSFKYVRLHEKNLYRRIMLGDKMAILYFINVQLIFDQQIHQIIFNDIIVKYQ